MTTKPYSFRLSEPAERKLLELAELYGSQARVIEVAIDRLFYAEALTGRKLGYRLDIYTWPAATGVDAEIRTTYHETPEDAVDAVMCQTEPFSYAVLQRRSMTGWQPCEWDGTDVIGAWPTIHGTNGDHPAAVAMKSDWPEMLRLVRAEHAHTGKPMIDIAGRLMRERHPQIVGFTEKLAWQAAERNK